MAALILVLAGTLGIIYGSSLYEMSGTNGEMLERYVELYSLEHQPGDKKRRGNGPGPATQEALAEVSPAFQLFSFPPFIPLLFLTRGRFWQQITMDLPYTAMKTLLQSRSRF